MVMQSEMHINYSKHACVSASARVRDGIQWVLESEQRKIFSERIADISAAINNWRRLKEFRYYELLLLSLIVSGMMNNIVYYTIPFGKEHGYLVVQPDNID